MINNFSKLVFSLVILSLLTGCGEDKQIKKADDSIISSARKIVQRNKDFSMPWMNDKKLAIEKLKESSSAYSMLSSKLQKDREIVEIALKNEIPISRVDKSFAKDKALTLLALKHKPEQFSRIDKSLKSDPDILLASLDSRYDRALQNLKIAPEELKNNPDFMLKVLALRTDKQSIQLNYLTDKVVLFPYIANSLKNDKAFIQNAITLVGSILCDCNDSYKSNRELALKAVGQYGKTLICLNEKLQKDKEVVLRAVKQDGEALLILAGLGSDFINNKEIVLSAINQAGPGAFSGIGRKLQNDKDIVRLLNEKKN